MLGGRDVTGVPPFKRDVTTVFQQYALFPHMNVFENVAFGLKQKRVARESVKARVAEALEMVKMGGLDTPASFRAIGRATAESRACPRARPSPESSAA